MKSSSYGWWFLAAILIFALLWTARTVAAEQGMAPVGTHLVTIYDRGEERTIVTNASTVRAALAEAGVTVNDIDITEPKLDTPVGGEQYTINIYRARPVVVEDGATRTRVMTAAQSPAGIAKAARITLYDEDKTAMQRVDDVVAEGGPGLKLAIDRATVLTFVWYGKPIIARTNAVTVGEFLKEKSVVLGAQDGVSLPPSTPISAGMTLSVWRNGVQTVTVEEAVPMPVRQIHDTNQPVGFRQVQTPGKNGKKQVTYEINTQDGREITRNIIQSVISEQPAEQVEVVGARNNYSSNLNEWLAALRGCEAGGVYTRNSGNGFYGAYQFMISTWDRIAPKAGRPDLVGVRPDTASPADQDMMIVVNTRLSSGGLASQNPGCYKKLGLSAFPPN